MWFPNLCLCWCLVTLNTIVVTKQVLIAVRTPQFHPFHVFFLSSPTQCAAQSLQRQEAAGTASPSGTTTPCCRSASASTTAAAAGLRTDLTQRKPVRGPARMLQVGWHQTSTVTTFQSGICCFLDHFGKMNAYCVPLKFVLFEIVV